MTAMGIAKRLSASVLGAFAVLFLVACSNPEAIERAQSGDIPFRPVPSIIEFGEVYDVEVWNGCGVVIEVGSDWYVPDRRIASPVDISAGLQPSDFNEAWDIVIFEDENGDGPSWVILDAQVTRLNDKALEVTHKGTGELIANFRLDPTPVDERLLCG